MQRKETSALQPWPIARPTLASRTDCVYGWQVFGGDQPRWKMESGEPAAGVRRLRTVSASRSPQQSSVEMWRAPETPEFGNDHGVPSSGKTSRMTRADLESRRPCASGAVPPKSAKICSFSAVSAPIFAKFGFDTVENEPVKNLQRFAKHLTFAKNCKKFSARCCAADRNVRVRKRPRRPEFGKDEPDDTCSSKMSRSERVTTLPREKQHNDLATRNRI